MMNFKTAMLGNITRQGVSRQFIPTTTKNPVLTLSQRTAAAQGGNVSAANAPSNPVRSFSSTQANRDNNNNNPATTHFTGAHQFLSLIHISEPTRLLSISY